MKVTSLSLRNFRNYDNLKINFSDKVNVFMGKMHKEKPIYSKAYFIVALEKVLNQLKTKTSSNGKKKMVTLDLPLRENIVM